MVVTVIGLIRDKRFGEVPRGKEGKERKGKEKMDGWQC